MKSFRVDRPVGVVVSRSRADQLKLDVVATEHGNRTIREALAKSCRFN